MHKIVSKYYLLQKQNYNLSKTFLLPLFLIGLMLSSTTMQANASQKRVALIMGISNYTHATQLPNPVQDATKLASVLSNLGFDVTLRTNLGINDMRSEVRNFANKADTAEVALVYFAGHGIEMSGKNYLIPNDAELRRDRDLEHEALTLNLVSNALEGAKRLRIIMLDACRNNPFSAQMKLSGNRTRSVSRGLAAVEPVGDSLIVYASKHGTVAEDGEGSNSPFAEALVKTLPTPGLEISLMFRRVRDQVMKATNRRQQPFVYGSISGKEFYFKQSIKIENKVVINNNNPQITSACSIWPQIATTATKAQVKAFLSECHEGIFYRLAKARLKELKGSAVATLTTPKVDLSTPKKSHEPAEDLYLRAKNYQNGTGGFKKDMKKALSIYMQAANQGHAKSMTDVGWMNENGFGTPRNYHVALEWYQKAADKGESMAMNNLGWMYTNGTAVEKNYTKAIHYYKKAIALGEPLSMTNLGWMYETGKGVATNYYEAFKYYKQAADAGDLQGLHNTGWMYAAGRGTKQNYKKGAEAVFKAIRSGNKFSKDQMIGNHTVWPIGFRKELQKILKNYGYYNGAADGTYGPGTVKAVRKAAGE
ncbi:MAG: caspase family protein [Hyphomicrobiales bacterium]